MSAWTLLGIGIVLMFSLFFGGWLWARKVDNYSLVDILWAFGIGITSVLWLALVDWNFTHAVAAFMVGVWSVRLGWHLQRRIRKHYPSEDSRYVKLREGWKGSVASKFFWFFQAQALSVILLALPFLMIALDADSRWGIWETCGLVVWLVGVLGEATADSQMAGFKKANQAPGAVCQSGLWYYSRHPNYFFEALIWCGFYLFACGSPMGWATIHAPFLIIYLLLFVTGIPPTEAAAVIRKGDAYRRYQKSTSPFIPWPPKSTNESLS